MDYAAIGMRVRYFRQQQGMSQEKLAELVDISVTHMSHIETGNTKLSLPLFIALAYALNVRTDELLHIPTVDNGALLNEISAILDRCTESQAKCILDIVKAVKTSFDNNLI